MATEEPCTACTWTPGRQRRCFYKSNVSLFYGVSRRGVWSLGTQYILKDRERDPPNYEPQNTRFLQTCTTIPVPSTLTEWYEPDNVHMQITRRIEGITLDKAWPSLSETEKHGIAKQTSDYLTQLRTLHSDQIESLDHGPLHASLLFAGRDGSPHGPLKSDGELWDEMAGGIKQLDDKIQSLIRQKMPPATPYTFSHGDLSQVNILVKDGKVTGIIDWEGGGYFPRWWEFAVTFRGETKDDSEWKALLRQHMENHGDAGEFWKICFHLRWYPELSERGKEILAALEAEAAPVGGSEKD